MQRVHCRTELKRFANLCSLIKELARAGRFTFASIQNVVLELGT
jgi:hypothetical protein